MLVFTRRRREAIRIGDRIEIRVLRVGRDGAPRRNLRRDPRREPRRGGAAGRPVGARRAFEAAVRIRDWQFAEPPAVEALYEAERRRWLSELGWDTSDAWPEVEGARAAGRLPGLLAVDDRGTICGWTYFLVDDRIAQVGSVVGESPEATRALIDSVVARAAGRAECVTCFAYPRAPGLEAALAAHGFEITRYQYLSRAAPALDPFRPDGAEPWRDGDETDAAALLRAAYGSNGRYFAAHGLPQEWRRYVHNLVAYPGCGRFDRTATRVMREDGRMAALV